MNSSRQTFNWHQLDDILYTSHEAFVFAQLAFYFRMFKKIVDKLIDTGIMKHYSENYYTKKVRLETLKSAPKVLCVNDLTFGFNIWLGFCCLSTIVFVAEIMAKRIKIWINNKIKSIHRRTYFISNKIKLQF